MGKLRFGVNYVPSKNWWYSWQDWDHASIAADLAAIADLNMDHVRIHCLWSIFQPNPGYVSATALDRLAELLDLAEQHQLDVVVAVLDGWLSGFAFYPAWQRGHNLFTDPVAITAEKTLFQALAERIGAHPRFLGFDLGNELGVLHDFDNPATPAAADQWQADMLAWCDEIAPGKLHVNGVDHKHWFHNIGFTRHALATEGTITSLHTWPRFTGFQDRYGPMGLGTLHLAEYSIELARAYHTDLTRPIWIQEFGATERWATPLEKIPDFAEQTIRHAASCDSVWGFTWWCSHDLNPKFTEFEPGEYTLGLLNNQNRAKPAGQRIAQLIEAFRAEPPPVIARSHALVMPDDVIGPGPKQAALWQFIDAFVDLLDAGIRPAIVLASRAADSAYFAQRGITDLHPFEGRASDYE